MKGLIGVLLCGCLTLGAGRRPPKAAEKPPGSPLDRYVSEATAAAAESSAVSPGSLWVPGSRLADAARDVRASQVDDVVTIVVAEKASAVASGTTKTARASSTQNSVSALAGVTRAAGPWANLAGTSGNTQLSGQGTTSRDVTLSTNLTARVTRVLPNGNMLVEATKDISINSERQTISVRGVVRPADLAFDNTVSSDRLADLEVRVNGKGVVGDAIKRPFFLYRLLLGLLPF
jgi:flagellar L-ring protein precursor FlgH